MYARKVHASFDEKVEQVDDYMFDLFCDLRKKCPSVLVWWVGNGGKHRVNYTQDENFVGSIHMSQAAAVATGGEVHQMERSPPALRQTPELQEDELIDRLSRLPPVSCLIMVEKENDSEDLVMHWTYNVLPNETWSMIGLVSRIVEMGGFTFQNLALADSVSAQVKHLCQMRRREEIHKLERKKKKEKDVKKVGRTLNYFFKPKAQ